MAEFPYPRFSLAERDRRWSALRKLMAEHELKAIVTPANSGHSTDFQASSRYLSHCGGGGDADITVIFPIEGDVTVGATSSRERWLPVQDWVTDVREARRVYGRVIRERLHEIGVDGERVGITGLGPGNRTPEGTILYVTMREILEEFPNTTFVDATELLAEVRVRKSDEEIEFLRRSAELVDAAFDAERQAAKPGAVDHDVWAEATAAMLRGGSEMPLHCNWISGAHPGRTLTRASFRKLERGDLIINELESSWAGYRAQGVQPVCVETCDPVYNELMKVQNAMWHEVAEQLRPGITIKELGAVCASATERLRPSTGPAAGCTGKLAMHGRGQGDDGPIFTGGRLTENQPGDPLVENMALIFKPGVTSEDGKYHMLWGDTVVVTPSGARRLGKREPGLWVA